MRFKCNPSPKHGDKRVITKFALFPNWLSNEIRWLEIVRIEQIYYGDHFDYRGWSSQWFVLKQNT